METTGSTAGGKRQLLFGLGIAIALAVAAWFIWGGTGSIETENAYIKANNLTLAAEVSAVIAEVPVQPNQSVSRGDLLVRLDDTPYQLAVAEARAHIAQVQNQLRARRADYDEAQAALEEARQDANFYQRQQGRNEKLGPLAVSEAQLDESRRLLSRARAQIAINTQKLSSLLAELGGSLEVPMAGQADLKVAQAQLDRALYQLSRTRIVSPVAGVVANTIPQVGELAHSGLTLISVLSTEQVWVEANLKETQLENVRPGLTAKVVVDAYPEHSWVAEVESLSPASGSEFALIPAQNASGNWVKVVQRVPVRLRLRHQPGEPLLRAGMSAHVRIELNPGPGAPTAAIVSDTEANASGAVADGQVVLRQ